MNVEIGAEAALFPEKEYINGITVAVYRELGRGQSLFNYRNVVSYFFKLLHILFWS
jgi:hypothetical protein